MKSYGSGSRTGALSRATPLSLLAGLRPRVELPLRECWLCGQEVTAYLGPDGPRVGAHWPTPESRLLCPTSDKMALLPSGSGS